MECSESLLAEFYAAVQGRDEDVATWSCRLEDLLDKAEEASVQPPRTAEERESVLRSRFWIGLQQQLKDSSRHKYDSIQSYDKLRVEVRQIEHEHKLRDKKGKEQKSNQAQVKMSDATAPVTSTGGTTGDSYKKLEGLVQKLTHQVANMQDEVKGLKDARKGNQQDTPPRPFRSDRESTGFGGQGTRSGATQVREKEQVHPWQSHEPLTCYKCGGQGHMRRDCPTKSVPTCWNCGVVGHTKYSCPAAHSLNLGEPLSGGRQ